MASRLGVNCCARHMGRNLRFADHLDRTLHIVVLANCGVLYVPHFLFLISLNSFLYCLIIVFRATSIYAKLFSLTKQWYIRAGNRAKDNHPIYQYIVYRYIVYRYIVYRYIVYKYIVYKFTPICDSCK